MTAKIERLSDARIQELSKLLYPHAASKELVTEIYRLHTELKRIAAHAVAIARWEAAAGKAKEIMDKLVKENEQLKIDVECDVYCKVCGSCGEDGCCKPEICRGGEHCMYPDYGKPHEYAAREKRLRELAITVGHGPECYADEFTRVIDHEGNAEMYTCTCGLDELRTILNREQEKP